MELHCHLSIFLGFNQVKSMMIPVSGLSSPNSLVVKAYTSLFAHMFMVKSLHISYAVNVRCTPQKSLYGPKIAHRIGGLINLISWLDISTINP
jgi:hypothetical protein